MVSRRPTSRANRFRSEREHQPTEVGVALVPLVRGEHRSLAGAHLQSRKAGAWGLSRAGQFDGACFAREANLPRGSRLFVAWGSMPGLNQGISQQTSRLGELRPVEVLPGGSRASPPQSATARSRPCTVEVWPTRPRLLRLRSATARSGRFSARRCSGAAAAVLAAAAGRARPPLARVRPLSVWSRISTRSGGRRSRGAASRASTARVASRPWPVERGGRCSDRSSRRWRAPSRHGPRRTPPRPQGIASPL